MPHPGANPVTVEWALGLCDSRNSRSIDVGAGARGGLLVVADGRGGHCTGWLGARLAVRALLDRCGGSSEEARFVGAADVVPDDWGWAGAMQSRGAGELVYEECAADFGDPATLARDVPRDVGGMFSEIDRVVANVPTHVPIHGLMVGCLAASIEEGRVQGAHAGVGRALLLRAGAHRFESLVMEHYLHLLLARMPEYRDIDIDPAHVPPNILASGLGGLDPSGVLLDRFEVELAAGDLLLLCSSRLDVSEDEVAEIARKAVEDGAPLDELARTIERRSATVFDASEAHRARDVAFVIAIAKPRG